MELDLWDCPEEQGGLSGATCWTGGWRAGAIPLAAQGGAPGSSLLLGALPNRSSPVGGLCCLHRYTEARPSQHRPRPGVDWLSGWMAIGTGWKPLLCTCLLSQDTVICEPFQSVTSWETQKGLSPDHHPRAVNSNQGGLQPEEGVSRMPGYPSASQRDKGEAEACDKSSTRGREKPGFTPSRRHPRCAQAYPRPGTPRSCSFLWWVC